MRGVPLEQIEEQRHASKRHEEPSYRTTGLFHFKPRERENRRPERHQQEQQRRRILRRVQKREHSEREVLLLRPLRWIAVMIDSTDQNEENDRHAPNDQQQTSSSLRV